MQWIISGFSPPSGSASPGSCSPPCWAVLLLAPRLGGGRAGRGLGPRGSRCFAIPRCWSSCCSGTLPRWNLLPLAVKEVVNDEHAWSILPGNVCGDAGVPLLNVGAGGLYLRLSGGRDRLRTARRQPRAAREAALSQGFTPCRSCALSSCRRGWPTPGSRLSANYLNLMKLSHRWRAASALRN